MIIIGGGPAGLAAAVQLKRYALEPRVIESGSAGGLLWNAHRVENYPGFPDGVSGRDLARRFVAHARTAGVRMTPERVVGLDWDDDHFRLTTPAGVYRSRYAIIASGTKPEALAGFDIPEVVRTKVFYEIQSLLDVEGARIVVVGGGDAAFDYALNLGGKNAVIILNRSSDAKCLPLLYERAMACPKITYRANATIAAMSVTPEGGLSMECADRGGSITIRADYLVGAVGREPQVDFISEVVAARFSDLEQSGVLHFVGDVKNGMCRQTAIAVGDGVLAAMRVYQTMKGSRDRP